MNGDDPEAVVYAAKIATEYRQKFGADAVIDMFCYRRFGHNEGDEPSFTQPRMYKKIRALPGTREIYSKRLTDENVIGAEDGDNERATFRKFLDDEFFCSEFLSSPTRLTGLTVNGPDLCRPLMTTGGAIRLSRSTA